MVKSNISKDVNYNESKDIEDEDVDYSAPLYDYKLYDYDIEIGLGKQKHTYSKYGIVYFPIYLIVNGELVARIGVFEIEDKKMIDILDDDGDVQLNPRGLLFFVSKQYLQEHLKENEPMEQSVDVPDIGPIEELIEVEEIFDEDDVATLVIPPEKKSVVTEISDKTLKDGIFKENNTVTLLPMLPEETKEQSDKIKADFQESSQNNWVEKFRKNNNYKIINNEGGGDCFFAVLRDAFKQVGKDTTVEKLRALLSKEVNEDIFEQYRTLYAMTLGESQEKDQEMRLLKRSIESIRGRIEKASKKEDQKQLLDNVNELLKKYNTVRDEKKQTNELMKDFIHMEGIDTVEKLRELVLTSRYWADTWAISTLEKVLNIKVIVLSQEAYESGDADSVLNCGQMNDSELEDKGYFQPDFYIITAYTGNHYTLVSYKDKHIFRFVELPYDIKVMVITKCLERNSGPYYLIKDFRNLKTRLGLNENEGEPVRSEEEYINADLYDAKTTLMFHQNSDNHPKAGKGSGEKTNELLKYNALNGIKEWRRKLDDTWMVPFSIDGNKWASVTHYFLAVQFKKGYPDYFLKYSTDSNTTISKTIKAAKDEYNKVIKTKHSELIRKDIEITPDPDFFTVKENPTFEMQRMKALDAKFNQNLDMKQLLKETQQAKLTHFERGKEAQPDLLLMRLRKLISS
jgi:hypothetical protein